MVSVRKVVCEFKEARAMPSGRLKILDGAVIEVDLGLERGRSTIVGKGIYEESDPDLGPTLRILVSDPSGDFEILFSESNWSGSFAASKLSGCDYRISSSSE